jgi:molybdopterin-guanine dinucleotide biosynthesis protein A
MGEHVFASVLAGGQSRRFGADKAMAELGGAPMIVRVGACLRPQVEKLAVVGHPEGAAALGCVSLTDPALPAKGPLLGVVAALEWAAAGGADWLLTAPCDAPFLPSDLAARLIAAARAQGAQAAFAATASGLHPLSAVWSPALAPALRATLAGGAHPPVHDAVAHAVVAFDEEDAFANVNTQADFARIKAKLGRS